MSAGHLASKLLAPKGILYLTSASHVYHRQTPADLTYNVAKSAVLSLATQLYTRTGLPQDCTVATLIPDTFDTEQNRKTFPDADSSKWLPVPKIAELLRSWAEGNDTPKHGSLVRILRKGDKVAPEYQ
eukprot:TRINITY_DN9162_c0_g1_i4.p1 TRINITY_DN9162_c0_g1~~TRINITY_DN9162_c0_g1_i4.p1  ORF type:complete len:128 (+),score=13.11 TRINITY_DN9162_c0_g1_i4:525-908(+)